VGGMLAHVLSPTSFTPLYMGGQPADGTSLGAFPAGTQVTYHANCGYEGYVDNFQGKAANLWWPGNNASWFPSTPRWRAEVQAPLGSLTDYFLNVLYPTTTAVTAMPATSLIDAANYYGVVIRDASAPQVVLFSKSAARQTSLSYTATYTGSAQHVVTGLAQGTYRILLNGSSLASVAVAADGMLNFTAAGGAFTIAP
jgi:hypothetical protein